MRALTCAPPTSFDQAISASGSASTIDVALARQQHTRYVEALRGCGIEVLELQPDIRFPDCCFVEDQVVVADELALITRSAQLSRRGEADAVRSALGGFGLTTVDTAAPATLDGGDVLRIGKTLFVGYGNRTNLDGVKTLESRLGPLGFSIVPIPIPPETLHLKSVCSRMADGVLLAEDTVPKLSFGNTGIVPLPGSDPYSANVLSGDGGQDRWILLSEGNPALESLAHSLDLAPIVLGMSEFRKADGALTCLSVMF